MVRVSVLWCGFRTLLRQRVIDGSWMGMQAWCWSVGTGRKSHVHVRYVCIVCMYVCIGTVRTVRR